MFHIPDPFARQMINLNEAIGPIWLARLPTILKDCEQHWDLTIGPPFPNLSFNYVAPAIRRDGTQVVVKACLPDSTGEFPTQSAALRLFGGHGMVDLLECNEDEWVMLLERLLPGTLLSTLEDDVEATSIAASVMRQLWQPLPEEHRFPSVSDWGKGFIRLRQHYQGGNGPFPPAVLERAERLFVELSASQAEPVLLHGDLHHENIMAATREPWLAIDPKGLVGEPAYEPGALLRNQLSVVFEATQPTRVMARRVDQLAEELELDRTRIRDWALAQAVLSAWWNIEDFGELDEGGERMLACAELLAAVKA